MEEHGGEHAIAKRESKQSGAVKMRMPFMFKISFSVLAVLFVGFLVLPSLLSVFPQQMDLPDAQAPSAGDALQVTLGRDSPNLGGNVFRDVFLSLTLSNAPGIATGKVTSEIFFSSSRGIAFDRAELTPDLEASGATVETEVAEGEDDVSRVKITISNNNGLPEGIIANLVFKVTKEFTFEEVGTEEHLITVENAVSAWDTDEQEISDVLGEPGGIDLAYAPVIFSCFFYMH